MSLGSEVVGLKFTAGKSQTAQHRQGLVPHQGPLRISIALEFPPTPSSQRLYLLPQVGPGDSPVILHGAIGRSKSLIKEVSHHLP